MIWMAKQDQLGYPIWAVLKNSKKQLLRIDDRLQNRTVLYLFFFI